MARRISFPVILLATMLVIQLIPAVEPTKDIPADAPEINEPTPADAPKINEPTPAGAPKTNASTLDIPADATKINAWIAENIKEFKARKAEPDVKLVPCLAQAEENVTVIKVRTDGTGEFKTITEAVNSIPTNVTKRFVIWIGGGEYKEKVRVNRTKPFVTFYGSPDAMPKIMFDSVAKNHGTWESATVAVDSDYFMAVNIIFVNTAPKPKGNLEGEQAVAMRISGDRAAFYNCHFVGFQDTLCDDKGSHFFRDCYIEGTVDFIFGNGKSVYLNTTIRSVADHIGVITAHGRAKEDEDSGFVFVHSTINGTGKNELGRAWRERPRVVFAYTFMGPLITPGGWSDFNRPERQKTAYYAEYNCTGPGATPTGRVKYAKVLKEEEAKPFLSMSYIHGEEWLLSPPKV